MALTDIIKRRSQQWTSAGKVTQPYGSSTNIPTEFHEEEIRKILDETSKLEEAGWVPSPPLGSGTSTVTSTFTTPAVQVELTDKDIDRIGQRVVELLAERLGLDD